MSKEFPVWNEKYERMGVTPRELYMRQNGLCWLVKEEHDVRGITIYCTDGKDKAETDLMLNPTFECVNCITRFAKNVIESGKKDNES